MTDLLTEAEHHAVATAAALAEQVAGIIADGASRNADLVEAVHHIHAVQRMILAQAAARAYPDRYRLLGGVVAVPPPSWWPKTPPTEPEIPSAKSIADAYQAQQERTGTS